MIDQFVDFIAERDAIRARRATGQPWPWTKDPILQEWSFCNIRREDDRVTRWIAENWRTPNQGQPDLWFAMVVARLVNWPSTLGELAYPVPWSSERFLSVLRTRKSRSEQVYGGAYMLRSAPGDKASYHAHKVLQPMWDRREELRPQQDSSLNEWHRKLMTQEGMGSFLAAQVVADLKYAPPLRDAPDWWSFAASGPGSRRGLNIVLGRDVDALWTETEWRGELKKLQQTVTPLLQERGVEELHAQDLQNCLCEGSKYFKAQRGLGRPKRRYRKGEGHGEHSA